MALLGVVCRFRLMERKSPVKRSGCRLLRRLAKIEIILGTASASEAVSTGTGGDHFPSGTSGQAVGAAPSNDVNPVTASASEAVST
jgi:hypothetical protein